MSRIYLPVIGRQLFAGRAIDINSAPIVGFGFFERPKDARPYDRFIVGAITGDSLTEKGINDGDWLMFRVCSNAEKGDLCVISTPHGLTVKYFYPHRNGTVRLESANNKIRPQLWIATEVTVQGVVVKHGSKWEDEALLKKCQEAAYGN